MNQKIKGKRNPFRDKGKHACCFEQDREQK